MSPELVDRIATQLRERYVVPDVGARAAEAVEATSAEGTFDDLDGAVVAAAVTDVLRVASSDRHLQLRFSAAEKDPAAFPTTYDASSSRLSVARRLTATR